MKIECIVIFIYFIVRMIKLKDFNKRLVCTSEKYMVFEDENNNMIVKKWKYDYEEIYISKYSFIIDFEIKVYDSISIYYNFIENDSLITLLHRKMDHCCFVCKNKIPDIFNKDILIKSRKNRMTYGDFYFVKGNNNFICDCVGLNYFKIYDIKDVKNIKKYDFEIKYDNVLYKTIKEINHIDHYNFSACIDNKIYILNLENYLRNNEKKNLICLKNYEEIDFVKMTSDEKFELNNINIINNKLICINEINKYNDEYEYIIYNLKEKKITCKEKQINKNNYFNHKLYKLNESMILYYSHYRNNKSYYRQFDNIAHEEKIIILMNKNINMCKNFDIFFYFK